MAKNQSAAIYHIFEDNPEFSKIEKVVNAFRSGDVIIYPTDTVYALGCDLYDNKAIERITRIKSFSSQKPSFSVICGDISQVSVFTKVISNDIFKIMKKVLPGPYTFILEANNKIPKAINQKRKTIGVRVPDNKITLSLVKVLGNPIITTSIKKEDDIVEYYTDPHDIIEKFANQVDVIVDGGMGRNKPSTIVDCTSDQPVIIREGLGNIEYLF